MPAFTRPWVPPSPGRNGSGWMTSCAATWALQRKSGRSRVSPQSMLVLPWLLAPLVPPRTVESELARYRDLEKQYGRAWMLRFANQIRDPLKRAAMEQLLAAKEVAREPA